MEEVWKAAGVDESAAGAAAVPQQPLDRIRETIISNLRRWRENRQSGLFQLTAQHQGVVFDHADLHGLDFSPNRFIESVRTYTDEDGTRHTVNIYKTVYLTVDHRIRLKHVNWTETKLSGSKFTRVLAHNGVFVRTHLNGAKWFRVDVTGSTIDNLFASGANLTKCIFSAVKAMEKPPFFSGCTAPDIQFVNAHIPGANFQGAKMPRCNFRDADISGADFVRANCRHGDFRGATVGNMDVTDADFSYADFRGVDLSQVVGFDIRRFSNAKLTGATLPAGAANSVWCQGCHCRMFTSKESPASHLSLVLVKPEGMPRMADIMGTLHTHDIRVVAFKTVQLSRQQVLNHYKDVKGFYFFEALLRYMAGRTMIALAVQGDAEVLLHCKELVRSRYKEDVCRQALEELRQQGRQLTIPEDQQVYVDQYVRTIDVMHCSDPSQGPAEVAGLFRAKELIPKAMEANERVAIVLRLLKSEARLQEPVVVPVQPALNAVEMKSWLLIIKPAAMPFVTDVFKMLERHHLLGLAAKSMVPSQAKVRKLYAKYKERYFYDALVEYVAGKQVVVVAIHGTESGVSRCRADLRSSLGDQIAGDAVGELHDYQAAQGETAAQVDEGGFQAEYRRTFESIHCSDPGDGEQELQLFFTPGELRANSYVPPDEKVAIMLDLLEMRAKYQTTVFEHPKLSFERVPATTATTVV